MDITHDMVIGMIGGVVVGAIGGTFIMRRWGSRVLIITGCSAAAIGAALKIIGGYF